MICEAYRFHPLWFTNIVQIYQDRSSHKFLDLFNVEFEEVILFCYKH